MGTELQYLVNFAFMPVINKPDVASIARFEIGGFKQLIEVMENKESMKKTMLKQEEIFKEQVQELHQLYRVQKLLMAELRNKELKLENSATPGTIFMGTDYLHNSDNSRTGFWSPGTISPTSYALFSNQHCIPPQTNSDYNFCLQYRLRTDPSPQEFRCSRDTFRTQKNFDLEQPAEEENLSNGEIPIFLKDELRIDGPMDRSPSYALESEIELTLSTGHSTDRKKQKERWRASKNLELGCCSDSGIPSTSSVRLDCVEKREERFKVEEMGGDEFADSSMPLNLKPPWPLQVLSFNRT